MKVERYAIFWADLNPVIGSEIAKARPVVVVSDDLMNRNLQTVVVCPLTSTIHSSWRSRIQVRCAGREAEIAVDQIRTISKRRLGKKVDRLDTDSAGQLRTLIATMYATA